MGADAVDLDKFNIKISKEEAKNILICYTKK